MHPVFPHMIRIKLVLFSALTFFSLPGLLAQAQSDFPVSTPEAEGISSQAVLSFVNRLDKDVDAVHSYMILRHGKLISQGWWAPYAPEQPHVMHSLSKSFTSTAIGMAIAEGKLSLNDQVISFFPEQTPAEPSQWLSAMRVRDLLAMNTGHKDEPRAANPGNDWVSLFLATEVDFKPGTHFEYNSAATYMLSAILQKVSGEKVVDYLDSRLWQPLGIPKPEWDTCPMGINTGGWGLHIRTEDIAKLGQLYLQKGMWEGQQIISAEWVEMATSLQSSNGSNPDSDWEQGYGYQFWRSRHGAYRGDGAFGQFCIVLPEQEVVVAVTSGTNNMWKVLNAVWEELLPAFHPQALPENKMDWATLQTRSTNLGLKPVQGESSSSRSKKLRKQTFQLADNQLGIQSIRFELHDDAHTVTMEMQNGTETLSIGSGTYVKGKLQHTLPYTFNMVPAIGNSGAWIQDNVYQLRMYFTESPARLTYTFTFEGEKLKWDSKLEYHLFGMRETPPLEGKVSDR